MEATDIQLQIAKQGSKITSASLDPVNQIDNPSNKDQGDKKKKQKIQQQ